MNNDKLLKLLRMTTSDNDHEALTAIRLINKSNVNWAVVIEGKANNSNEVYKYKSAYSRALQREEAYKNQISSLQLRIGTNAFRIENLEVANRGLEVRNKKLEEYINLPWYIRIFKKKPV